MLTSRKWVGTTFFASSIRQKYSVNDYNNNYSQSFLRIGHVSEVQSKALSQQNTLQNPLGNTVGIAEDNSETLFLRVTIPTFASPLLNGLEGKLARKDGESRDGRFHNCKLDVKNIELYVRRRREREREREGEGGEENFTCHTTDNIYDKDKYHAPAFTHPHARDFPGYTDRCETTENVTGVTEAR